MLYYRLVNNELYDFGSSKYASDCLETDIISQEELNAHQNKVIVQDGVLVLNPDYEQEEAEKERARINMLSLTKREVFLALYRDKGITPEQLRAQIQDTEALIEFDYANDYFRGNSLIDSIGALLGYTPEQLDNLFIYKSFTPPADLEPEPEPSEEPEEEEEGEE